MFRYGPIVAIVMFGWIPAVVAIFMFVRPPRRAVVISFLVAWMFLPMAMFEFQGIPDYTKMSATCTGIMICILLMDTARMMQYRPHWADVPMIVWCLVPFMSSIDNGLGVYDGMSAVVSQSIAWGIPYFIGRIYFNDHAKVRELAVALMIGGLIYVPLCLWEVRMSPQLHRTFYGFHQHSFYSHIRMSGTTELYRPMVFMQSGIMVGNWIATAGLAAAWLWLSGSKRQLWSVPLWMFAGLLLVTEYLCRSLGAMALMIAGLGAMMWIKVLRNGLPVIIMLAVPLIYMPIQIIKPWDGMVVVDWIAENINEDRAKSLQGRFEKEVQFVNRAKEKPVWGWGSGDRMRPYRQEAHAQTRRLGVDGMWYIAMGKYGMVGLISFTLVIVLPAMLWIRRCRPGKWMTGPAAGASVLAMILGLYMIDNLLNAMINPIYMIGAGALTSACLLQKVPVLGPIRRPVRATRRRPATPSRPPNPTAS
ncbi:MAG: hypothetical protein CMJ49_00625 [Planctomycetaceae bacterium]|nr:hypothetical protein [Planctomycetaceae bacterium]